MIPRFIGHSSHHQRQHTKGTTVHAIGILQTILQSVNEVTVKTRYNRCRWGLFSRGTRTATESEISSFLQFSQQRRKKQKNLGWFSHVHRIQIYSFTCFVILSTIKIGKIVFSSISHYPSLYGTMKYWFMKYEKKIIIIKGVWCVCFGPLVTYLSVKKYLSFFYLLWLLYALANLRLISLVTSFGGYIDSQSYFCLGLSSFEAVATVTAATYHSATALLFVNNRKFIL